MNHIKILPTAVGQVFGGKYPRAIECPVCGEPVCRKSTCVFVHEARILLTETNDTKLKVLRQHRVRKGQLEELCGAKTEEMFK